jgi:two-component system chemotaxis response regulator CheB
MPNRDILAIGTSAGGVEALRFLAREFPKDLPAAVLVVIHLPAHFRSSLDAILTQDGALPACFAGDGMSLERGRIYIGPPDRHLLVDGDKLTLGLGPRENNARPAIDPLFRSVALCCGPRAIGAVLTGALGDGASGLRSLHQCGGITVVQDPGDAAFPGMPEAALTEFTPNHVVSLAAMPALLGNLLTHPVGEAMTLTPELKYEVDIARGKRGSMADLDRYGRRSFLACPDCHGVMWEIKEGDLVRYRCHVGHAYTAELMSLALDENLQRALGSGLRALDERIALAKSLQREANRNGHNRVADSWRRKLSEYEREAQILRDSMRRVDEIAARAAQAAE